MINITNLQENDYERMEGEFFCKCFNKKMPIEYDKNMSLKDVDKAIENFYDMYPKLLNMLCKYTNDYRKETMEFYPDVDYKEGLYNLKNNLDILNYVGIEGLRLELRDSKIAFNLRGWCDWAMEEDLQWIIYDNEVVYVGAWDDTSINSPGLNSAICNYCAR